MRLIVLIITTITLLGGGCTSDLRTDVAAPAQLTQTKSLPAALATARGGSSVSDLRLPSFAVPAIAIPEAPRAPVAEQDALVRRGHRWVRPANVTARGPPRG